MQPPHKKHPKRRPYTNLHLPGSPHKAHKAKTLHKFAPASFVPENISNEDPTRICTCQVSHTGHTRRRPHTNLHLSVPPQKTPQTRTLHKFTLASSTPEKNPNEDPTQICTCQVPHTKHTKRRPYTNLHLPVSPTKTPQTKTLHKFAPARFPTQFTPSEDPTQIFTCQFRPRKKTNEDPTQTCTCQVPHTKRTKRRPYTNLHLPISPQKTPQTKTLHKFAPAKFPTQNTPSENPTTQICTCQFRSRKQPKRKPDTNLHLPSSTHKTHQAKTRHKFVPARFASENTANEDPTQTCTCQVPHTEHIKRRLYTNLHLPASPQTTFQTKTLHKFALARCPTQNTPGEDPTKVCTCQVPHTKHTKRRPYTHVHLPASLQKTQNEDPTQMCTWDFPHTKSTKRRRYTNLQLPVSPQKTPRTKTLHKLAPAKSPHKTHQAKTLHKFAAASFAAENIPNEDPTQICTCEVPHTKHTKRRPCTNFHLPVSSQKSHETKTLHNFALARLPTQNTPSEDPT